MARHSELAGKIEATFDLLKELLPLVSSFPRSVNGCLLHYVRILLGYQMLASEVYRFTVDNGRNI